MLEFSRAALFYHHLDTPLPIAASIIIQASFLQPQKTRAFSDHLPYLHPSIAPTTTLTTSNFIQYPQRRSTRNRLRIRFKAQKLGFRSELDTSSLEREVIQWEVERSLAEVLDFIRLLRKTSKLFEDLGEGNLRGNLSLRKSRRRSVVVGNVGEMSQGLGLGLELGLRSSIAKDLEEALRRWQSLAKVWAGAERKNGYDSYTDNEGKDAVSVEDEAAAADEEDRVGCGSIRESLDMEDEVRVLGELFEAFLFAQDSGCGASQFPSEVDSFERMLSEVDPLSSKSPPLPASNRTAPTDSNSNSKPRTYANDSLKEFECRLEQNRERSASYSSFEEEGKSDLDTPVARIHLRRYNSCTTLTKKGLRRPSQYSTVEPSEPLVQYAACSSWGSSWSGKSRRGSESSTFSCGSQRFRFSKAAPGEGELSPIVEMEYDWSDCSDDGFSSDEDEEVMNILQPDVCIKSGGSVLKTYDYEYSTSNSYGFTPFAVTVSVEEDTEEECENGRWSPVSIPPSQPEQEQLLSDLSRYTNQLIMTAAKLVGKDDHTNSCEKLQKCC